MKKHLNLFVVGLAGALSFTFFNALNARADFEVSASVRIRAVADFQAPLAASGAWITVGSYGRCWRPAGIAAGWRPYSNGMWVWTDYGWYWESSEPWAWACYHYGYWVDDPTYGWIWMPGVEWAPAWVSWRVGDGYIGWAPRRPPGRFFTRHPRESAYVFVGSKRFGDAIRPSAVIVNNAAVFRHTSYVAGAKQVTRNFDGTGLRKAFVNDGPGVTLVEKAAGRTFGRIPIRDADRRTPLPAAFTRRPAPAPAQELRKPPAAPKQQSPAPVTRPPARRENPRPSQTREPEHRVSSPAPSAPRQTPQPNRQQNQEHKDRGRDHNRGQ